MYPAPCFLLPALIVVLAWQVPAQAEPIAIVTYAHEHSPEPSPAVSEALSAAARAADFDVSDAFSAARANVQDGAVPEEKLAGFARTRLLMEEGWRSYLEARPTFSATRLAQARTEAMEVAALQGGVELLAEISLRLGVVKLALGREAEAADDFLLAHQLDPLLEVNQNNFKPEVVERYAAALAEARESHSVLVSAGSKTASVFVDGQKVTSSKVLLRDGLHLVSAVEAGFVPSARLLSVSPLTSKVELAMGVDKAADAVLKARERVRIGASEADLQEVFAALHLYSETNFIVTVASVWRRGEPALLAQRCQGNPTSCGNVVEVGYPPGGLRVAAEALFRQVLRQEGTFPPLLQADVRLVRPEAAPEPEVPGTTQEGRPWWKNRWIWVGAGAAAVIGGAVWAVSGDDELRPVFSGDRCSFGGC